MCLTSPTHLLWRLLGCTPPPHMPPNTPRPTGSCTVGQQWFNTCIKVFTIVFSYINLLPVPWRIAILMDALAPNHRSTVTDEAVEVEADPNEVGVEFYGRPTEALWFHLPRHLRRNVAICLNIGWVAHYASLGAHIYYWKYWDTQTWPVRTTRVSSAAPRTLPPPPPARLTIHLTHRAALPPRFPSRFHIRIKAMSRPNPCV